MMAENGDAAGWLTLLGRGPKTSVPRHERFQHVRDQRRRINRLAIGLRMQRGVAIEVGLEAGRAPEGQLDALGLGQRPQPQLARSAHREIPRLKNSG